MEQRNKKNRSGMSVACDVRSENKKKFLFVKMKERK
jgi:hypothetical protein